MRLPPTLAATPRCSCAARTDRGLERETNEDAFLANPELGVFAVADGLGGIPFGEIASSMAVDMLEAAVRDRTSESDWGRIIAQINQSIWKKGQELSPVQGIGTTLTALVFAKDLATLIHVGDSCALARTNGETWTTLTEEHTVEKSLLRDGVSPEEIPPGYGHVLTRCLGPTSEVEVDVTSFAIHPGDQFLLATDGISKPLDSRQLQSALNESNDPQTWVDHCIREAYHFGAPDNATAVGIRLPS